MKKLILCLLLAAFTTTWAIAQNNDDANKTDKSNVRTVTGCLTQGDSAKEFQITGNDGSTWEVRSDKVMLADHVGQQVSATGVVSHNKMHNLKEDSKEAAKDTGVKKSDREHGHMTITDLQTVSNSCAK